MFLESFLANQGGAASLELVSERCYASAFEALRDGNALAAGRLFGCMALLAPRDSRPWMGLAACQERLGNWHAAAGLYGVGAALGSDQAWCLLGRARAFRRLGLTRAAARALEAAEERATDSALAQQIAAERQQS